MTATQRAVAVVIGGLLLSACGRTTRDGAGSGGAIVPLDADSGASGTTSGGPGGSGRGNGGESSGGRSGSAGQGTGGHSGGEGGGSGGQPIQDAGSDAPDTQCAAQVELVKADLSAQLAIPVESIDVLQVEETTWDRRCLGIDYGPTGDCFPTFSDMIAGCFILLETSEYIYEYHTDQEGRFEQQLPPQPK